MIPFMVRTERELATGMERSRCLDDISTAHPGPELLALRVDFLNGRLTLDEMQYATVLAIKKAIIDSVAARAQKEGSHAEAR